MENETSVTAPAYLVNGDNITVIADGNQYNAIRGQNPNFDKILDAIRNSEWEGITKLFDIKKDVVESLSGLVEIVNGTLYFDGSPIHNVLADRILDMVENNLPIKSLVKFLENLMRNPSRTSVQELYLFLESGNLPVTEDGCFLAYKKVRNDFKDIHSGTFDNSVGKIVEVPRNSVDDERNNTCSYGLHFCSKDYLPAFGSQRSNRVVIVKINPADVVSIPSDYKNTKGRCCKYEVIAEFEGYNDDVAREAFDRSFYSNEDLEDEYDWDSEEADDWDDQDDWYAEDNPL
jgi:hypothetical protein